MYKQLSILVFLFGSLTLRAQDANKQHPEFQLSQQEIRTQMEFMASDL